MLGDLGDCWSPARSRARQRVPAVPTPTEGVREDLPELEDPTDVSEDASEDVADVLVDGERGGVSFASYLPLGLVRLCGIQA